MNDDKAQSKNNSLPKRFWIIGAGRFGRIAMDRISRQIPGASISIVDRQPVTIGPRHIATACIDGIRWLNAKLHPGAPVDMVIPAIPVHVAFEWIKSRLKDAHPIRSLAVPDAWLERIPHGIRGKCGQVYASHAGFICPDDCPEPKRICTHTGRPRPKDLFRMLAQMNFGDVLPIVLRSHQLIPGVGGVYAADLLIALETIRNCRRRPLMIATACRCHGVIDFVQMESGGGSKHRS